MIISGILMYFGALLVPALYFVATGWNGPAKKKMLWGIGLQFLWMLMVWGFVWYSWKKGSRDYFYGWALIIPGNLAAFIWYLGCILSSRKRNHFRF
ncbi:MAG TPA: hypothetical protein VGD88_09820 [Opitutaceae bacterium]